MKVFTSDGILQRQCNDRTESMASKKGKKALNPVINSLSSNMEIETSLKINNQRLENFILNPIAVLITVDKLNGLAMCAITADQSELIMKIPLPISPDDLVSCLHFSAK